MHCFFIKKIGVGIGECTVIKMLLVFLMRTTWRCLVVQGRSLYSADLPVAAGLSFLLSDAMLVSPNIQSANQSATFGSSSHLPTFFGERRVQRVVRHSGWEAGPHSLETTDCLQDSIQELSYRLDLLDGLMCHDEEVNEGRETYREIKQFKSLVKAAQEDLGKLRAIFLTNTKATELAERVSTGLCAHPLLFLFFFSLAIIF